MCCECDGYKINRRKFIGLSAIGLAGTNLLLSSQTAKGQDWAATNPFSISGKNLVVQPVLIYSLSKKRPATSWRPWGGLQTEADISAEVERITKELLDLQQKCSFPVKILSVVKIDSVDKAVNIANANNYDVPIVYAASGGTELLETVITEKRNNIIFLRHRSGPIYLWYEILHNRFLRKGGDNFELDEFRNPGKTDIHDVVVDDYNDVQTKLNALYGVHNFKGKKIVALGGSGGWCCPQAPKVSQEKFKIDIQNVEYKELEKRIQSARNDKKRISQAQQQTHQYLSLKNTTLHTDEGFVVNAFLLFNIFKDILKEHKTNAFTIQGCMNTVIPISETTACLPLSLLNDEGFIAFCESDFNVIPSGILLYYIAGKPVFLNDPTFPHHGMVTAAHCTAPRRMDGVNYSDAKIVTHFESDYGATPKVELQLGSEITMICPDSEQKNWLGFNGVVEGNPFYDICRSQYDIQIKGNWKKLLSDHRGFHWMMACGDYMPEMEHACRKIDVNFQNISTA